MDERLDFNENWNGKLNCQCFTTIRLHNPIKNCVGAIKQIYLKDRYKGDAKIMHVSRIPLDQINLPMAKLDSGLLPDELRAKPRAIQEPPPQLEHPDPGLPRAGVPEGF